MTLGWCGTRHPHPPNDPRPFYADGRLAPFFPPSEDTMPASIDALFNELGAIYGARFTNQWPAAMVDQVKQSWARELAAFENRPDALQYAIDHLPTDHVPMVLEIRDLCRHHITPSSGPRRKPLSDEERARAVEVLRAFNRPCPQDPKDWARKLRAREMAGERLTLFQRQCWREALAHDSSE
jgi:hypothetical protein